MSSKNGIALDDDQLDAVLNNLSADLKNAG